MTSRFAWIALGAAGAVALAAGACVLDFDKFEGGPVTTTSTSSGGTAGSGGLFGGGGSGGATAGGGGAGGADPCSDLAQNGTETDIDCGGADCEPCINGLHCAGLSDCQSRFCNVDTCDACASPADCTPLPDSYCDPANQGGTCTPLGADGAPCADGSQCLNGLCVDDVCCGTSCNGFCEACSAALTFATSGVCAPVGGGTDPDAECAGPLVCDGAATPACASLCGLSPAPPGGLCPAECTGGCTGGDTCHIACDTGSACASTTVTCPPGFACEVSCAGQNGCNGATIVCPESYACNVSCTANFACRNAHIACSSAGQCSLGCSSDNAVCRDAAVTCGGNTCAATCAGSGFLPNVLCGGSCDCQPC